MMGEVIRPFSGRSEGRRPGCSSMIVLGSECGIRRKYTYLFEISTKDGRMDYALQRVKNETLAPSAFRTAFPQASRVDPLVRTSSISNTCLYSKRVVSDKSNSVSTFCHRSYRFFLVWVLVSARRFKAVEQTGKPDVFETPSAINALWL